MNLALIIAGGPPPGPDLLKSRAAAAALLVCADSGAEAARRDGLLPAAVIGDMDSISPGTLAHFRAAGVEIVEDRDPEATDLEKAVRLVRGRLPRGEILVLGSTAGRLDHLFGHIGLMCRAAADSPLVLEDEAIRAYIAGPDILLDLPAGATVSFFALGEPVGDVTTAGLRYPLEGVTLSLGGRDSVSNVVDALPASIRCDGRLLVVEVKAPGRGPGPR